MKQIPSFELSEKAVEEMLTIFERTAEGLLSIVEAVVLLEEIIIFPQQNHELATWPVSDYMFTANELLVAMLHNEVTTAFTKQYL